MAGSGRRTFAAGEVLTASNVMNYLMDQSIMTFAGTAARGSAIGTAVAEGMVSYLKDSNRTEYYDGASWKSVSGSNLIYSGTFTNAATISIGSDADPLFTSKYDNYKIILSVTASSDTIMYFRLRANTTDASGSNYDMQTTYGDGTTTVSGERATSQNKSYFGFTYTALNTFEGTLFGPALATPTTYISNGYYSLRSAQAINIAAKHTLSTSYNGITFGNFSAVTYTGTVRVYGLEN